MRDTRQPFRQPNRCAVEACGQYAPSELTWDGEHRWLCPPHFETLSGAIAEVANRFLARGETYLPATTTTVLVEYVVKPDKEAEFLDWRQLRPANPPGFIGETLYRADWDGEVGDANLHFVNIGHWAPKQAFYDHFQTEVGRKPGHDDTFEAMQRRRAFLRRHS